MFGQGPSYLHSRDRSDTSHISIPRVGRGRAVCTHPAGEGEGDGDGDGEEPSWSTSSLLRCGVTSGGGGDATDVRADACLDPMRLSAWYASPVAGRGGNGDAKWSASTAVVGVPAYSPSVVYDSAPTAANIHPSKRG